MTTKFEPHFMEDQRIVSKLAEVIAKQKNCECLITDLMISLSDQVDEEYGRLIETFISDHLVPWQVRHNLV